MPRTFVTGDTHRQFDRIARFCQDSHTTKDDTMIILGDAGINYHGDIRDYELKKQLKEIPISFFCIHGNHEMRPHHIKGYDMEMMYGNLCWIEAEFPNISFAIDGHVYEFGDFKKCVAIGGAYSPDKYVRLANRWRWFADEQPSDAVKLGVEKALYFCKYDVDLVLSHTCPLKYIPTETFLPGIDQSTVDNSTEVWLDELEARLTYKKWLCGHYHTDKIVDKIRFLYNDIICLDDLNASA